MKAKSRPSRKSRKKEKAMSADYKSQSLRVCASATGGADVDVSASLFVDGETSQMGDDTLTDVHLKRKCASLQAHTTSGQAKVRLILVVVPLVGNGEFEVELEFSHPAIPNSPKKIVRAGDIGDEPKTFSLTFKLP
jgi:hypothetical protein